MRKFVVIVKFKYKVDTKVYDQIYEIGNGLYKIWCYGNKRSTMKSIERQVKMLTFDNNKITEIVDIIETE